MELICSCCKQYKKGHAVKEKTPLGQEYERLLCDDCIASKKNSPGFEIEIIDDTYDFSKPRTDLDISIKKQGNAGFYSEPTFTSSNRWTKIFKALNILMFICLILVGVILGSAIGKEIVWGSEGSFIGGFVGLIAGTVCGSIFMSFSMVVVEISENISAILSELKKEK